MTYKKTRRTHIPHTHHTYTERLTTPCLFRLTLFLILFLTVTIPRTRLHSCEPRQGRCGGEKVYVGTSPLLTDTRNDTLLNRKKGFCFHQQQQYYYGYLLRINGLAGLM